MCEIVKQKYYYEFCGLVKLESKNKMDFEKLKQRQKSSNTIEALTKKLEQADGGKKDYTDEREWKLKADEAGNGYAVIRFLPSPDEDETLFIKKYSHAFKNAAGRWFIENCPTTAGINLPCPVCEANKLLWDSGLEANKKIASERKRKLHYYSNILVVKDPANPENNGKVFLFKFGTKIFEKIKNAATPTYDEKPIDAFNMFDEGANFKLKMRKVAGYPNYDESLFDAPAAISDDEDVIKAIFGKTYNLKTLVDPKDYRSYDELKQKYERFISGKTDAPRNTAESVDTGEDEGYKPKAATAPATRTSSYDEDETPPFSTEEDEGDDSLAQFKSLLNE